MPLSFGSNDLLLEGDQSPGNLVGSDNITVTSTFSGPESPLDVLRISEINYNPADPSAAELSAGFTDKDFLNLLNSKHWHYDNLPWQRSCSTDQWGNRGSQLRL